MCDFRYPKGHNDSASVLKGMFPVSDSSLSLINLEHNRTWYFALMVVDSSGNWSAPQEQSLASARINDSNLPDSNYNIINLTPPDTQHLFNDSLLIWSTSDLPLVDTVDYWSGPLAGFIAASPGYLFRNGENITKPLWVQVPYYQNINSEQAENIRLYSFDVYTGEWEFVTDTFRIDSALGTICAKNTSLALPFIFLIDTLPPTLNLLSNISTPVLPGIKNIDTVLVNDNIKNYSVSFMAGPGNEAPWDFSLYV